MKKQGKPTAPFWRWLLRVAEKRIHEAHMNRFHHDRGCHNCKRWYSIVGLRRVRDIGTWHEGTTCDSCGYESVWFMGFMIPLAASEVPSCPIEYPPEPDVTVEVLCSPMGRAMP